MLVCVYIKVLHLYTYIACWMSELYLQCGSYICSVLCVKYLHSDPHCLVNSSNLICYIYVYLACVCQMFGIYGIHVQFGDIFVSVTHMK